MASRQAGDETQVLRFGRHRLTVREVMCRTILSPTSGFLGAGFTHTLNPYSGCSFGTEGCGIYCYAQRVYPALARGLPWGTWVDVKMNAPEIMRSCLARARRRGDVVIFMSSVTDPFQPLERRYRITRRCLEAMLEDPPDGLVVQTRAPHAHEAIPVLSRLRDAGTRVTVNISIETDDDALRREMMPLVPSIPARVRLARRIREAGLRTQVTVAPLLPHDAHRLAAMLEPVCDRVIVDTLALGDGADGRRSRSLPVAEWLRKKGRADLLEPSAHEPTVDVLRARLGDDRVALSADGFNMTD